MTSICQNETFICGFNKNIGHVLSCNTRGIFVFKVNSFGFCCWSNGIISISLVSLLFRLCKVVTWMYLSWLRSIPISITNTNIYADECLSLKISRSLPVGKDPSIYEKYGGVLTMLWTFSPSFSQFLGCKVCKDSSSSFLTDPPITCINLSANSDT